ncbi:AI-2E family transporter [Agitococcus lubricus]|uniref:Putative PurR-regulated permease PerM n=1 Tax=Agitococcus lubricus TaxID=1077255 RepID=A0A2T5IZ49_9GAMM|nr:AI-2E family transporter [Agitococcus lubricus]PTQ89294.1 putative PurR-regulated permease PerM [Agitococcus lubricus]
MNTLLNRWPIWLSAGVIVWLLYALQSILMPFFAGALLAYLCNPLVNRLTQFGFKRTTAVTSVFSVLLLSVVAVLVFLLPVLWRQFIYLETRLPILLRWINRQGIPWLEKTFKIDLDRLDMDLISSWLTSYWQEAGTAASHVMTRVMQSSLDIMSLLGLISLVPVVTFYLLLDWDKLINNIRELIPRHLEPQISQLSHECNEVLSAFLRGQLIVMLLLGLIYAIGLQLIGLKLGIIIGLLAGLASIIPYFGFIVGIISASIAAMFQTGLKLDPLINVWIVFAVGQILEGWVLQPYLIGDKIGLPPVGVIFAVMAGGQLFGFIGMLLALPVAAIIMVLLHHAHQRYRQSEFYQRQEPNSLE